MYRSSAGSEVHCLQTRAPSCVGVRLGLTALTIPRTACEYKMNAGDGFLSISAADCSGGLIASIGGALGERTDANCARITCCIIESSQICEDSRCGALSCTLCLPLIHPLTPPSDAKADARPLALNSL